MQARKHKKAGFSLVYLILALAFVAVIILVGHYVVQGRKSKNSSSLSSTNTAPRLTYCDNVYGYCFKYPNNWSLTKSNVAQKWGDLTNVSVESPSNKTSILFSVNLSVADGTFTIASIDKSTLASQGLDIIGAYSLGSVYKYYTPSYVVAASHLIDSTVSVGQTIDEAKVGYFTTQSADQTKPANVKFEALGVYVGSVTDAKQWFTSPDAQTGLKILDSLYKQ